MDHAPPQLRPPLVPGYGEAEGSGLLPVVPEQPPTPLPGLPASRHFALFVGTCIAGVLVVVTFQELKSLVIVALLLVLVWVVTARRFRARFLEELEAGYYTSRASRGMWRDPDGRYGLVDRATFDLTGLWWLADNGRVRSAPERAVLPAGHYPSPNREQSWELWTGVCWLYDYRDPPA